MDFLEFSTKYIREFGIIFRPIVEISMGTEPATKLSVIDEEKLNNSTDEITMNSSFMTQNSFNFSYNRSESNINFKDFKDDKNKTFYYKSVIQIIIKKFITKNLLIQSNFIIFYLFT